MIRRIILILILMLFVTACGAAPAPTQAPAATERPATEAPATEAPAETKPPAFQSLEAPTGQPSDTAKPAPTQVLATPTDTPLPTLELPTEGVNPPARMVWDGTPTYPGESTPGYAFRVSYDPELWALTIDQFGFPALGHRNISGCVISVTTGRGLPPSMTVEHDILYTGNITFDVGNVYENGALKFVTYTGGNGAIFTGFEVDLDDRPETCLEDALAVLSTLTSVPVSQATPQP